jgi:hypothetical protein
MFRLTQLYIYLTIILLLCCYWLLVSASKDHHQANIYRKKNPKMLLHVVQKHLFYGIPCTTITSLWMSYL